MNEEEIRDMRVRFSQEKEDAVKTALELQKKALSEQQTALRDSALSPTLGRPTSGNSALIVKLQREIKTLRDQNREVSSKYAEVLEGRGNDQGAMGGLNVVGEGERREMERTRETLDNKNLSSISTNSATTQTVNIDERERVRTTRWL